jgi:hypothetical protein
LKNDFLGKNILGKSAPPSSQAFGDSFVVWPKEKMKRVGGEGGEGVGEEDL